jgi:hypothetical protein
MYQLVYATEHATFSLKGLIEDIDENGDRREVPLRAVPAVVTPEMLPEIREAVQ